MNFFCFHCGITFFIKVGESVICPLCGDQGDKPQSWIDQAGVQDE